jgi:hypothetical protein
LSEKPAELGVNRDLQGLGLSSNSFGDKSQGYIDLGIGVVSSAANASVNTVSAIIGTDDNGRLDATCNSRVQWYVYFRYDPASKGIETDVRYGSALNNTIRWSQTLFLTGILIFWHLM